ncbi:hypothetical protein BH23PAT1_BH23PAT1_3650 [soil metagenome]
MKIKTAINLLESYWRDVIVIALAVGALLALLWFRIGTLSGGITDAESQILKRFSDGGIGIRAMLEDPIYLPYNTLLQALQKLGALNITSLRLISSLVGVAAAISFYAVLKKWHTDRVAILGTILFVTSSWFLQTARMGTPDVLYLALIIFFFAGIWLQHSRHRSKLLGFLLVGACFLLYVPGLIWFVVLGGVWQFKRISKELSRVHPGTIILYALGGMVLLLPLIWAVVNDIAVLKTVLGLPSALPPISDFIKNLLSIPSQIFLNGIPDAQRWLAGLPLLDVFSIVMFIIGVYWYGSRFQLDRTTVFAVVLLMGSFLIALGEHISITLLMPFVYLIIAAGITYMLSEWFYVFPRNPIARTLGVALITSAVLLTSFYHLNLYYRAWPNAPETKTSLQQRP